MALQTNQPHLMPHQHSRIYGTMRFVARRASFEPDWRVLERERSALIAMALNTAGFVSRECLGHGRTCRPMRIVAIDARHGIFRNLVSVWLLKLRHHLQVASGAQLVDLFRSSRDQPYRSVRVNRVASDAGNRILHMAALNPPRMRHLIQVASHADLVCVYRCKFGGIPDVVGRHRTRMFGARSMAGFAGVPLPGASFIGIDDFVRTLGKIVIQVFMTCLAGFGAGIILAELSRCFVVRSLHHSQKRELRRDCQK